MEDVSGAFDVKLSAHRVTGVYDDVMSRAHSWSNPRHGVVQTGRSFATWCGGYVRDLMLTLSSACVFVFGVDTPKHVPCSKEYTQRARDMGRAVQPYVQPEGQPVVTWTAAMPTSDQIFGDRTLKRKVINDTFATLVPLVCPPRTGQKLYITGTRHGCVLYEPFKSPLQITDAPKVGEAELRWVSMLLDEAQPAGTWLVHSKDTDNLCIAVLHFDMLLQRNDVLIDCDASIINLRTLVQDVRKYFIEQDSRWDARQLVLAMQLAGNDFQLGIPNCAHKSFWDACMKHSKFIRRIVQSKFDDHEEDLTFNPHALQRLVMAALYERYCLHRILPPLTACTWDTISAGVMTKTNRSIAVPDSDTIVGMCQRARWNMIYWWRAPFGKDGVPNPLKHGWRKRDRDGKIVPRDDPRVPQ